MLPNFFLLGAAKCATTSFANYLRSHPDVFIPEIKEVAYFNIDGNWAEGQAWYEAYFDDADDEAIRGDATPAYLYVPEVLERMAATVDLRSCRFMVLVRDPVARTYSHYQHRVREGPETRSFTEVLDEELGGEEGWGYVGRGRYLELLRRWEPHIDPDRLHVALFDDVTANPAREFAAVCRFLGVDDGYVPDDLGEQYNTHFDIVRPRLYDAMIALRIGKIAPRPVGRWLWDRIAVRRDYAGIDPADRDRLRAYFAPHNRALGEYLGRDLRELWGY